MAEIPKKYKNMIQRMYDRDKGLRNAQLAYERHARLIYKLPSPLDKLDWVFPVITTAPYDALRGATRALSNLEHDLEINPVTVLGSLEEGISDASKSARERANEWEKTLKWCFGKAKKRRLTNQSDIVWSSVLYHEVIGQIINLPTQAKAGGLSGSRKKAVFRLGDYALKLSDPKTVHVDYSDYMPERMANVTKKSAQEIVDFWGDAANDIAKKIKKNPEHAGEIYVEFDCVDYDERYVWAAIGNTEEAAIESDGIILFGPEPWLKVAGTQEQVPFLPWIAVAGGTNIDPLREYQRKPLLYGVWRAEKWAASNILSTILMSQAIAEANAPTNVIRGPGADDVEFDYTEPGTKVVLPNQYLTYERVRRAGLDDALKEAVANFEDQIRRSTVAEILVTGSPMGGVEAYAGYNLQIQQAIASLGDYKELGETFMERSYEQILLIAHYTGQDIVGPNEKYTIRSEDINPEAIHLDVNLKVDVPTDRLQRANTAIMLAKPIDQGGLGYSPIRAMRYLGETDPEGAISENKLYQLDMADMRGRLKRIEMEASGEIEQMAAQMAQQMIAQMMEQQQQQQQAGMPPGGGGPGMTEMPGGPPGIEGVEGQGFNPAMGGEPPATASPNATFEGQMGQTRGGGETII